MSIDKITSKILSDAKAFEEEVLAEAKAQSDAVLKDAEDKAGAMLAKSKIDGENEKSKVISRRKSVSDIDARKVILEKKQELISECFAQAEDKLKNMDEDKYVTFLASLGANSTQREGLLIFNEIEKAAIGEKVVRTLNEKSGGNFKLAEETRKIKGGYVLSCGQTFINNTIEAIVDEYRSELTAEVAKMLFDKE